MEYNLQPGSHTLPALQNQFVAVTSRRIRQEYPEVKQTLEEVFRQPEYSLATTGQGSIDVLMKYVPDQ